MLKIKQSFNLNLFDSNNCLKLLVLRQKTLDDEKS